MHVCLASAVMPWRSLALGLLRPDFVRLGFLRFGLLHLGPLRFTPYGLCAASGLVVSMALVRRCAGRSEMDPEAAWDAGVFAIFSCFLASRLLLAMQSPVAFAHYPLLLLGLPSLTLGGLLLAGGMTALYLRHKHLSIRPLLDTLATPAATLAAFLELGHLGEGSQPGMPTTLPWGVPAEGAPASLRVHPLAFYGVFVAALLAIYLWKSLPPRFSGEVGAFGLVLGGGATFALNMLSAPYPSLGVTWLEPAQWVSLAAMVAGALLWAFAPRTRGLEPSGTGPVFHEFSEPFGPEASEAPHPSKPLHMEVH